MMAEQEFMNMLRDGNPNYLDALARSYSLSDGPRFDTGNSLRRQVNLHCPPYTLFKSSHRRWCKPFRRLYLNDYYMQMIEDSKNIAETSTTCNTLLEDYVQRYNRKRKKMISPDR